MAAMMQAMMQMMGMDDGKGKGGKGYGASGGKGGGWSDWSGGGGGGGWGGKGGSWKGGGWAPPKQKVGDWPCPACGDLQFARNTHCRRCGAEKPPGAEVQAEEYKPKASGDMPDIVMLKIRADSQWVQQGYPQDVMAISFEKGLTVFSESHDILQSLLAEHNVTELVKFDHDADCERYPEIFQAWKEAGQEDNLPMIAMIPGLKTWAVGMGGSKNAARAVKLALALTIAALVDPSRLQETCNIYPNFGKVLAGLAEVGAAMTADVSGGITGSMGQMA